MFKGTLTGTTTSPILGMIVVIRSDEKIEGLLEEFVVYARKLAIAHTGSSGFGMTKTSTTHIRPGDKIIGEGEIVLEIEGKENLEFVRMKAEHHYNVTLKCGF